MPAIKLDNWRAFTRDERLKITAAYALEFKRQDVREAMLNNQGQGAAIDRLEAFIIPLIMAERSPAWSPEVCREKLATPIPLLIPTTLASYWYFLTRERQGIVISRLTSALHRVGVNIVSIEQLARIGQKVTP